MISRKVKIEVAEDQDDLIKKILFKMKKQHLNLNTIMKNQLLNNKTAVVFGAGGNLGKQVAKAFINHGAKVFISDIDEALMSDIHGAAGVHKVDALNEDEVNQYLDDILATGVQVDVLINLSGSDPEEYNHGKPAMDVSLDQFLIPMKTATGTQFITAKAGFRHMYANNGGVIIFITSTLSKISPPFTTALTVSHAGTEALVRTLANEWGPGGVRVVGIRSEAMTESPTINYTFAAMGANVGLSREEMQHSVEEQVPLRRLTSGTETADVAVLAASDLAGFMTGAILNHSGGHVLD